MPARRAAVLLDLDGTLIDTVPFILESVRHAFQGRDRCPTEAEWIAGIGTPLRAQLSVFATGPADLEALAARYRSYQQLHHDRMTHAFPGAVAAVRTLHELGHPLGVVTGKMGDPARRALVHVGLAPYLGALVGADGCPEHKPHPAPLRRALELLGAPADDALYVGDSAVDVAAANAAGVISVAALWGACSRAVLEAARPRHLLDEIGQLPALVARLGGHPA